MAVDRERLLGSFRPTDTPAGTPEPLIQKVYGRRYWL